MDIIKLVLAIAGLIIAVLADMHWEIYTKNQNSYIRCIHYRQQWKSIRR